MWLNSLGILYAVVVGANTPTAADVQTLRFADDDAVAYAQLLRDAGAQVTLLTTLDPESRALHADVRPDGPPTRAALEQALLRIDAQLRADRAAGRPTEAMLVYSGHGDVEHGEGYIQFADARLRRSDLYDRVLPRLPADRVHVIVDACKSYFLAFERGGAGTRTRHAGHFVDLRGPALFPNVGFLLSTSSGADSHEWEEFQGGVFSHEVRSALRGAGDANQDGLISYAEVGAFVQQANAAIPNARYRPRFTVVPPHAALDQLATALLAWRAGPARKLVLDRPTGRVLVEDERGRRLADAHPAEVGVALRLPLGPLFVRSVADQREYAMAGGAGDVKLSSLEAAPVQVARRGALAQAFRELFALPFGAAQVAQFVVRPGADLEPAGPSPAERALPKLRWASLAVGLSAAVVGVALTGAAVSARGQSGATQAELTATNGRIDGLNGGAAGMYGLAGVSLVTTLATAIAEYRLARARR